MARTVADFAQMSFPDFELSLADLSAANAVAEASLQDNYLFAIYPPDNAAIRCHEVGTLCCERLQRNTNVRPREVLHATLCVLKSAHCLTAALGVGDSIASAAFDVEFDCALSFDHHKGGDRKYPYVLSCESGTNRALHWLQQQLSTPLMRMGLLARRGFTPHITLLYDTNRINKCVIEPICWTVTKFALVHSHFGEAWHEEICCWKLPNRGSGTGC